MELILIFIAIFGLELQLIIIAKFISDLQIETMEVEDEYKK